MVSRREFFKTGALAVAGTAMLGKDGLAQTVPSSSPAHGSYPPGEPGVHYTPVVAPNTSTLPWKLVDGVKVFHLVAEPVKREFAPGLIVDCWGYNGETPGPMIEVVEGDRCRFYVTNNLEEPTTVHWHGILLPNGMDGVAGLTQRYIEPGQTFKYEITFRQYGTYMYHPHFDEMVQMGLGMQGMLIVHPRKSSGEQVDRDFAIMLSEWAIKPGTSRPDPLEMTDFNILTMNSKAFPGTAPLVVKLGDRVRIRFGNLSAMDHHPIHLHGFQFKITGTDGGRVPEAGQVPETSVLVPVGSTREIEFVADAAGDWAMHCHMTHHVMNQMGHDIPNLLGVDTKGLDKKVQKLLPEYMTMGHTGMGAMAEMNMPVPPNSIPMKGGRGPFGVIDMGGMFTILKVRENLANYDDPGWYRHPEGTVASEASEEELRRDLGDNAVKPGKTAPPKAHGHHHHH